jgi:hypothetical protein
LLPESKYLSREPDKIHRVIVLWSDFDCPPSARFEVKEGDFKVKNLKLRVTSAASTLLSVKLTSAVGPYSLSHKTRSSNH